VEKIRAKIIVSFRAKVLVPVLGVMMLLLAVTVCVVNARITRQVETEAQSTLATAEAVFRDLQTMRSKTRLRLFRNLPNEPRYKAALQTLHPGTVRDQLATALAEQSVDFVLFTPEHEPPGPLEPLMQKRDPLNPPHAFTAACAPAVQFALNGEEKTDTIRVGEKIYEVVAVPVYGVGHALIGALTVGEEVGLAVAQEFSRMTRGQIVLLAGGQVVASTLDVAETGAALDPLFQELSSRARRTSALFGARKVVFGGERYFCSRGYFPSVSGDASLGYVLLSSYEQPLQALRATQHVLLAVSLVAILLGSAMVWFLVRKVTEPLRELRDSAEAVGQGDFSRRVAVRSQDECGELALVFNQMTEKIKGSREQLEMTVETLKTTQAQLIQSEKLSGIGEFVAGVAHELNNPLTSVMGFSELLAQADGNPQHKRHLEMIHKSAQRCQKIVQSLLSFARRHQPERKVVCVNRLVEAAVEILNYQLRTSNIEVIAQFDPQLPPAMVDPHQLQQVFLNLINNARQAIEAHQPKGWIKITTTTSGANVRVTFQDNGPGIAPENLSKLFDPFFTTKEVGMGTGLGLSLCYGIIKEHGGTITPRSKPGEGATFVIELPIAHEAATAETPRKPEPEVVNPREGVGKKVLVIDDEEPILHMMRDALTGQGYQVDLATNGEAALQHLQQHSYDLALCDWKMPGLNGRQVYERVRASNPKLSDRMIFITGDVINAHTQKFLAERNKVCLMKPFSLGEFRTAIHQALAIG
jgi:two-component system NtrC family sensor kinase